MRKVATALRHLLGSGYSPMILGNGKDGMPIDSNQFQSACVVKSPAQEGAERRAVQFEAREKPFLKPSPRHTSASNAPYGHEVDREVARRYLVGV